MMVSVNQRHPLDVSSILKEYGDEFKAKHKLCLDQLKAFKAITSCRSAALGSHSEQCNQCGHHRVSYNSCRNRNCNKCQYTKQLIWIDKLKSSLPVCRYFHMVFTIPSVLHKLFYLNQRVCYDLMFKASWQSLQKVSRNPNFLGVETGSVAVLHTWGQALTYHPHIHMIVPAGGLSEDGFSWIKAGKKFFVPVKILSRIFRGVLWALLKKQANHLKLPDDLSSLEQLKSKWYAKNWHVYTHPSMAGPQSVVQ